MTAEPAAARALSDLRALAVSRNLELATLRKRLSLARADLRIARTRPYNPELEASYSTDEPFAAEGERDFQFGLSQVIETGGKRGARMSLAELDLERVRLAVADRERTLLGDVSLAFFRVIYQQQRLGLNAQAAGVTASLLRVARQRVKEGDAAPVELGLARAAHEKRLADGLGIQSELAAARLSLAALAGEKSLATAEVSGDWSSPPALPLEESLVLLALSARPDLEQRKLEIAVAQANERLARSMRRPDVTVGIAYEKDTAVIDEQAGVPELVDPDELLGIRVGVPLPIVNRRRGEIERARAEADVAAGGVEALALEIRRQVLDGRRRADQVTQRRRLYERNVLPLTEQNLLLNRQAYEGGWLDIVTVLRAQDDLNEARQTRLDVNWDLQQALIGLETAIGKPLAEVSK